MRHPTLVLGLTALLGGVASAQPGPPPGPPPPPMDTTTTMDNPAPPEPQPPPTPEPPPPPPPQPQPTAPEEPPSDRPEGISVGLGVGYGLPTSLETPNLTSARLRLSSGLQIEPMFTISNTSQSNDTPTMETETKITTFGVRGIVRIPLVTHSKVDFEGLGTLGFTTTKTNPPNDFDTTTDTSFSLGYGIGVAYWISRHWNFSMSVTNPIVSYDHTKRQTGPGMSTKTSDTTVGLIFVPTVFMMIHLYN